MKYRDIVKLIERDGWVLARTRGSHRHYAHPEKPGIGMIAGHLMSNDVPLALVRSILKQAGLKRKIISQS
ncbi:MAG TPA: type II toxin-antitoxin system HicA family toxin [Candidatus Dormibacteraeota bacterium]|nr:type II toxin-antitoxin system HicA family toxin [Candidatus Dormibacteraeota bacterium]